MHYFVKDHMVSVQTNLFETTAAFAFSLQLGLRIRKPSQKCANFIRHILFRLLPSSIQHKYSAYGYSTLEYLMYSFKMLSQQKVPFLACKMRLEQHSRLWTRFKSNTYECLFRCYWQLCRYCCCLVVCNLCQNSLKRTRYNYPYPSSYDPSHPRDTKKWTTQCSVQKRKMFPKAYASRISSQGVICFNSAATMFFGI